MQGNLKKKLTNKKQVITAINENNNPFTSHYSTKAMLKNVATGHLAKREYIEHILSP